MYQDILTEKQKGLLPLISRFKKTYYLAGGTAIALHLGYRRSIDFDLFTQAPLKKQKIALELRNSGFKTEPLLFDEDQQHHLINGVKCTFLYFPYPVSHEEVFDDVITLPSLLDLSAMKAFSLGRRSKWKDFVDLYFLIKDHFSINEIVKRSENYFPGQITEKLFRNQLAYQKDIDFSEQVDYLIPNAPSANEIKEFLIDAATNI